MILLIAACNSETINGNKTENGGINGVYTDETELEAAQIEIWWDEGFGVPKDSFVEEILKQKFKNTQFIYQTFQPPSYNIGTDLFSLIKSNSDPDLIVFDARYLPLMLGIDYLDPIPEMVSLEIDYETVTELRSYAPDRELYVLPYGHNVSGLYYNKTISMNYN